MLIMIIIKIIFLYFKEIAHTDDFPSTGTRLVLMIGPKRKRNAKCTEANKKQSAKIDYTNRKDGCMYERYDNGDSMIRLVVL